MHLALADSNAVDPEQLHDRVFPDIRAGRVPISLAEQQADGPVGSLGFRKPLPRNDLRLAGLFLLPLRTIP